MSKLFAIKNAALMGAALFALVTPAMAQDDEGGRRGRPERAERADRPAMPQRAERAERPAMPQRAEARQDGGNEGWRGRSEAREGQWRERARVRDAGERFGGPMQPQREQTIAPAPVAQPPRSYGGDRQSTYGGGQRDGSYGAYQRGRGWQRPQPQGEVQPPVAATPPRTSGVVGDRGGWQGRSQGNRATWQGRSDGDRSRDWQRDRERREDARRDERRDDARNYNRGYRDGNRSDNRYNGSNYARWDRSHWRNDRRYDWYRYRAANRSIFSPGRYYAPYRNYSYSRINIGFRLGSLFYSNRYWIDDPWRYRLPDVYGPYRWVRYYDDALLVDIYSGEVVDVIHDFFW